MQSNGKIEWVKTDIKLFLKPYSDDVIGFSYMENIHEKKLTRSIVDSAIAGDYDYIACINRMDGSYVTYVNGTRSAILPPTRGANFTLGIEEYVKSCVLEEDRQRVLAAKDLNHVVAQLEQNSSYDSYYRAFQQDGSIARKKLRFSYLNGEKGLVVLSQTDITHVFEENQRKNEILGEALQAAQQANAAKTDFLSRMSHEIRTPMNAIIGMSAIAAQNMEDKEQVADCIGKIGISSRFLLSLINDILDMSRIESGKVLLKKEKISFAEFMSGINDICYSQAVAKNINYECMVYPCVEDCYIGDTMKLQQVLINVLSNAVKFTPNGGKVSLSVQQKQKTATNAILCFTIQDTGCGISENFLPKLFQPFSQEHSGITSAYGGTGLGLAICKNLVSFMDGKINVSSTIGEGSTFVIQVKLGISEQAKQHNAQDIPLSFEKCKVLVADNDVSAAYHTQLVLKEMGIQSWTVNSGKKALANVVDKWKKKDFYHLILLDWKMPEMDGIETAKKMREIVGAGVTIVMAAYDGVVMEEAAKTAGVDLLIRKPVSQSDLIPIFEKISAKGQAQEASVQRHFDFSGKRVLLVEDHPLNVEVARKLLEHRGFQVEHAENGLKAIERFSAMPAQYYDVILMDIRMPIMDGLQAAKKIRLFQKEDAKTIPIIAMTANAFEDDIEKSKEAGMNAHLAKPIEPKRLFQTLYDFLEKE